MRAIPPLYLSIAHLWVLSRLGVQERLEVEFGVLEVGDHWIDISSTILEFRVPVGPVTLLCETEPFILITYIRSVVALTPEGWCASSTRPWPGRSGAPCGRTRAQSLNAWWQS